MRMLLSLLGLSAVAVAGSPIGVHERGLAGSSPSIFKGAVLFKNGYQTSCEIAVLGKTSGFIAANCFDYTSKSTLDPATRYTVFFDDEASGTVVLQSALEPNDIHIHPDYDPATLANNIAVIKFNKDDTREYVSFVAVFPARSVVDTYLRRTLGNVVNRWNAIEVHEQVGDSAGCDAGFALYKDNPDWYTCTTSNVQSANYTSCSAPYGTKYSSFRDTSMLSGLYSHSVIYGSDSCDGKARWLNYYTNLWPYLGFAVGVLHKPLVTYNGTGSNYWTTEDIESVPFNKPSKVDGAVIIGGDFYAVQRDGKTEISTKDDQSTKESPSTRSTRSTRSPASSHSSGQSESDDSESLDSPTEKEDSSSGTSSRTFSGSDDSDSGDKSSGLTRAHKIIIGVVVPIVGILVLVGLILLYNIWRSKRQDRAWDPRSQTAALQNAAWDLGAGTETHTPPPYEANRGEAAAAD
ncbi:hypothetical protein H4R19_002379, partial [Coemansia spiralis]